ncbi:uncharacterized protein LOC129593518 isoform X2 [Paramacrobiotus metropolitanus]|uniref:uncharacterized protein LOC129593518 isoform X2 n=1 Tax=Paramacrobiotus metropolitanus TaxID=2943436 RepID=UPI002445D3A8|nr:uncharacterized protein LOC129593518 isoform X2 [Paramacrobiotus metropolitanus]
MDQFLLSWSALITDIVSRLNRPKRNHPSTSNGSCVCNQAIKMVPKKQLGLNVGFIVVCILATTAPIYSNNLRSQRQAVVDTVTTEDEIVRPDGVRIPVATSSNTQVSPVAPNAPQVVDTVQTQDSIITPGGAQIPVATSSNTQRVARQFVSAMNAPQVVDTVSVQDEVVHPSGAIIPVGSSSNTVVSPVVAPVPQVIDTVQVQDTVVSPSGQEIPLASSVQTQVQPVVTPVINQPQVMDTVSVQDSIIAPNGAVIPLASSIQNRALPVYPSFYAAPQGGFYKREFHDKHDGHHKHSHLSTTVTDDLKAILAPSLAALKKDSSSSSDETKQIQKKTGRNNHKSSSSESTSFAQNVSTSSTSFVKVENITATFEAAATNVPTFPLNATVKAMNASLKVELNVSTSLNTSTETVSLFSSTTAFPDHNTTAVVIIEKVATSMDQGNTLKDEDQEFPVTAADLESAAEKVVLFPKNAFIPTDNQTTFSPFVGNETFH